MGAKASTANGGQSPRTRTFSTSSSSEVVSSGAGFSLLRAIPGIQVTNDRQRARSLSSVPDLHASHEAIAIPPNSQSYEASAAASPDTDSSSNEEAGPVPGTSLALGRVYATHSLPSHIWSINEYGKCSRPNNDRLVLVLALYYFQWLSILTKL
ncbi:hypothetical protein SFRURICE_003248 [Spodoptera frugiperda]|nr:hypothetical protein SFRURICE_003248 [Spodoptera frugiperda]